jgi:hypothetical protein
MFDFEPTKIFMILTVYKTIFEAINYFLKKKKTVQLSECRLKYELNQSFVSSVLGVKISRLLTLGEK